MVPVMIFRSKYLTKDDCDPALVLTVDDVDIQTVQSDRGKDEKPIMSFTDSDKLFVVNGVNWDTIADWFGDDSDLS